MTQIDKDFVGPSHRFHASWRSGFGAAALICGVFVVLFLCMLFDASVRRGLAIAGLFLFGGGLVLSAVQVAGRPTVLSLGPHGIGGRGMRSHIIPWHELDDVRHERTGGNDRLVMTLAVGAPSLDATRRPFNARSTERAILLGALRRKEMHQAIEAAHRFARENRIHA